MSVFSTSPTHKPPAPDDYYLASTHDIGNPRSLWAIDRRHAGHPRPAQDGGDSRAPSCRKSPTQKPLALYSGIVHRRSDGSAEISFEIPEFAGTARVMAVAWTATKLAVHDDVTARDPVVLTATLRASCSMAIRAHEFLTSTTSKAPRRLTRQCQDIRSIKVTGNPTRL